MATEIRVPTLGESVTEATVAKWHKKPGEPVKADEILVELETDKVTVEVPAPAAGVLSEIVVSPGETIGVGGVLGKINGAAIAKSGNGSGGAGAAAKPPAAQQAPAAKPAPVAAAPAPAAQPAPVAAKPAEQPLSPAVRKAVAETGVDPAQLHGTGKDGRVTKGDVLAAFEQRAQERSQAPQVARPTAEQRPAHEREERVPMTRLRKTIALRLKEAQHTAAMLTTFNEVDMSAVMALRTEYKEAFEKRHGVKLGFMGFFVKACVAALKDVPAVNGEIDGDTIIYKNHYDIGVAVGTEKGLVVPVVRDADQISLAEIERVVADYGRRARDGQLKLDELQGGTFTISNGGVYGSLMSTPILNAPQSGILGMHKIQERPVAIGGKIEIRPMMYLALSYDHRLVDGREAVTFLVHVKEYVEAPQRLLLDV
jgi:2-oxoglutarate dehydrogenase E2 component (dihydrolipoamide succinyltransferase)